MIAPGAGLRVRRRMLLVLLVCIALPLVGGCSSDPECIAVPFLPQCFEDDDEEEKTDDTATQTRVRVNARADDIDTTMVALRHTLDAGRRGYEARSGVAARRWKAKPSRSRSCGRWEKRV
jgi:hypothetical protein